MTSKVFILVVRMIIGTSGVRIFSVTSKPSTCKYYYNEGKKHDKNNKEER